MTNIFRFTPDSLTVNGITFAATYTASPDGLTITATHPDDEKHDIYIKVPATDPRYPAAAAAAGFAPQEVQEDTPAAPAPLEEERPETISAAAPAPLEAEEPAAPVAPEKLAHGPVPEKTFIGTTITGPGYAIFFDPDEGRTRVTFTPDATPAMVEAAKAAGFFLSPRTKSYNKKLTFRAYRAAVALSESYNA